MTGGAFMNIDAVRAPQLLAQLRSAPSPLPLLDREVGFHPEREDPDWDRIDDPHGALREEVAQALWCDLRPEDHPLVRRILEHEISACSHNDIMHDGLRLMCVLLFWFGQPEDVPLLHHCKSGGVCFDAALGLDWPMCFGAGVEATLAWMRTWEHPDRDVVLEDLEPFEEDEAFAEEVATYRRWMAEYFADLGPAPQLDSF